MSDPLFENLERLFATNEKRFNAPIKESYDEYETEQPEGSDHLDVGDEGGDEPEAQGGVKAPTPEKGEELPPEAHTDVFPQPSVKDGIIFINPDAIPNDYPAGPQKKGHIVNVYKIDKDAKQIRVNELKLGMVPVPFSIIKNDGSGREYVTKEDISKAFARGNYVFSLLKLQPKSLDRNLAKPDKLRKQFDDPSAAMGTTDAARAKAAGAGPKPGTPEWTAHIAKLKAANGVKEEIDPGIQALYGPSGKPSSKPQPTQPSIDEIVQVLNKANRKDLADWLVKKVGMDASDAQRGREDGEAAAAHYKPETGGQG